MRSGLPLLLSLFFVNACAAPAADEGVGDEPPGGESSDDLAKRTLNVHPGAERRIGLGLHEVRPTLKENGNVIDVFTDDLVIAGVPAEGVLSIELPHPLNSTETEEYGFQLSFRAAGTTEWQRLEPKPGDASWQWGSVLAFEQSGVWFVSGFARQYTDAVLGTAPKLTWIQIPRQEFQLGPEAEFRVHVLPVWNFWDWDEEGYVATLEVSKVEEMN